MIFQLFVLIFVRIVLSCKNSPNTSKVKDLIDNILVQLVSFSLEVFMELLIAGTLNLQYSTAKDFGYYFSIFVLIYALFVLILYVVVVCYHHRTKKFAAIFEQLDTKNVWKLSFHGVFMIRRLIIVCAIMFYATSTFQIITI